MQEATTPAPLAELLREATAELAAAGVQAPDVDALLIAGHVLGESRGRIEALSFMGREVPGDAVAEMRRIVALRATRVPLQHITGLAPFRSMELEVGAGVFVPRPETEQVVQLAIDELERVRLVGGAPVAIDLCTGSGALSLAMASEVAGSRVWTVEMSEEAAAFAARNIARYGDGRVTLAMGDVSDLLAQQPSGELAQFAALRGSVHVVASNPPYVPSGEIPVDPEVRDHDPALALYSGADGLDLIRDISKIGLGFAVPGGLIVLEHTEDQGKAVREILESDGWEQSLTHPDLTGRDRATTARAPKLP